jgi:hypothetical protein
MRCGGKVFDVRFDAVGAVAGKQHQNEEVSLIKSVELQEKGVNRC